jgi:hypothetical protein
MVNPLSSLNPGLDWNPLPVDSIELSPSILEQAAQLTRPVAEPDQWQAYLLALGVLGFRQWMGDRAPDLTFDMNHCSLFDPGNVGVDDATNR